MGYRVIKAKTAIRIVHTFYKESVRKEKWLSRNEARLLGFRPEWTLEEMRGWAKQLSLSERQQEFDRKRLRLAERASERAENVAALLPQPFWNDFVRNYSKTLNNPKRAEMQCAAAGAVILDVNLPIDQWGWNPRPFEAAFQRKRYSRDYAQRIEKAINEFLAYVSFQTNKPLKPVKALTMSRARSEHPRNKASAPLRPDVLERAKDKLLPAHYRWLLVSVWFGLRPEEIDQKLWRTLAISNHQCLVVRQPKIGNVEKVIPILFKEQTKALTLARTEGIARPLAKTVKKYTGCTLYGGRKGFVRLMKEQGRKLYEISAWMGHSSVDRTRKDYEEPLELIINE